MVHTLRVASRLATDPYGQDVLAEIRRTLDLAGIEWVRTARVYRAEGVTGAEAAYAQCRRHHLKRARSRGRARLLADGECSRLGPTR